MWCLDSDSSTYWGLEGICGASGFVFHFRCWSMNLEEKNRSVIRGVWLSVGLWEVVARHVIWCLDSGSSTLQGLEWHRGWICPSSLCRASGFVFQFGCCSLADGDILQGLEKFTLRSFDVVFSIWMLKLGWWIAQFTRITERSTLCIFNVVL